MCSSDLGPAAGEGREPAKIQVAAGAIVLNEGRTTAEVRVHHPGDRRIQVGSHDRFFEVKRSATSIEPQPPA